MAYSEGTTQFDRLRAVDMVGDKDLDVVCAMKSPKVLGMILAGGKGERLLPLTAARSEPAVPFGGQYRIIDCDDRKRFHVSNFGARRALATVRQAECVASRIVTTG